MTLTETLTDRVTNKVQLGSRLLIVGALLVTIISTLRLYADVGRPFDGMITYHNVIAGEYVVSETTPAWWLLRRWNVVQPTRALYTANGHPYSEAPQAFADLWARGEDRVLIEYADKDERLSAHVPITPFSVDQFIDLRAPTLIIAITLLLIALLLHTTPSDSPQHSSLFLFAVCAAFGFGIDQVSLFWLEDDLARALDLIAILFTVLTSASLVLLARSYIRQRRGWLGHAWQMVVWGAGLWAGLAFCMAAYGRWLLFNEGVTPLTQAVDSLAFYSRMQFLIGSELLLVLTLSAIIITQWRRRREHPIVRADVRSAAALLIGLTLALPNLLINLLNRVGDRGLDLFFGVFDLRFLLLFIPLFSTAAIVRHGAFGIQSRLMIIVILLLTSALGANTLNALFISSYSYLLSIDEKLLVDVPSLFLPSFVLLFILSGFWAFQSQFSGEMARWFRRGEINQENIDRFFHDFTAGERNAYSYNRLVDLLCRHFRLDYAGLWLYDPEMERHMRLPFVRRAHQAHPDAPDLPLIWLTPGEVRDLCTVPFLPVTPSQQALPRMLDDFSGNPLMQALIPLVTSDAQHARSHLFGLLIVSRWQDRDVLYEQQMRAFSRIARELTQHLLRSHHEARLARTNTLLHNEIMARISLLITEASSTHGWGSRQRERWLAELDDTLTILRHIQKSGFRQRLSDLKDKIADFARRHPWLKLEQHIDHTLSLPGDLQADIVQWVTEALNNAARHSGATKVTITLAYQAHRRKVRLMMHDNGKGMVRDLLPDANNSGLRAMEDGVIGWNGSFTLETPRYGGTCLTIDLPYPEHLSPPTPSETRRPARAP